ncbi:primosomal protein [Scytonema sp. NUACC21]
MARAIERIERDISVLEEAIQAIAKDLQNAYINYLTTLGQTLRQQLNQASYHLCTQGYPESFLRLSLNQRQQLQQSIRKLGQQTAEQLQALMKSEQQETVKEEQEKKEGEPVEQTEVGETNETSSFSSPVIPPPPASPTIPTPPTSPAFPTPPVSSSSPASPKFPPPPASPAFPTPPAAFSLSPLSSLSPAPFPSKSSNPIEIAKWQQSLERAMQEKLKLVSRDANLLLQRSGILPKKLPEPILEAAAAAVSEAAAEIMPGPPNLLSLVIEVENEQSEEPSLTQIMALNLRLGEIEFVDTTLSSCRKQIRSILVQLNKLGQDYQKKQRERSIAEAEAAWRAIWFDE